MTGPTPPATTPGRRLKPPIAPELQRRIQDLILYKGRGYNQDLVEDIILNALKLLTDVEDRGDVRVIRTAVRELRYAFRLFKPYAEKRKVTIFGSARTKLEEPEYQQAVEFGRKMAAAGWMGPVQAKFVGQPAPKSRTVGRARSPRRAAACRVSPRFSRSLS